MIEKFIQGWIGTLVRHALSTLGGYLIAFGLSHEIVQVWQTSTADLVIGLVTIALSVGLSRFSRSK